jgi:hypothetical protein
MKHPEDHLGISVTVQLTPWNDLSAAQLMTFKRS